MGGVHSGHSIHNVHAHNFAGNRSRGQDLVCNREINVGIVIPAKAGIQSGARPASPACWIPAFAGMTENTGL